MSLPLRVLSTLLWLIAALPTAYLYVLALASLRRRPIGPRPAPATRFAIVIPAHDEAGVIGRTVAALRQADYPAPLFDVHVAADHCTDGTAEAARAAGAIAHERVDGPRTGKGAALAWALQRILGPGGRGGVSPPGSGRGGVSPPLQYDAVVVFDADTVVAPDFLRVMDARVAGGDRAVQGQHRISNPADSWYAALASAMMLVQNRLQNQGRSNLGLSAFNMGDSICLDAALLAEIGWGEGLTEDYDLRFYLLARGVRIVYEPAAVGQGEAPVSWAVARRQRERWLAGTFSSSRRHRAELLRLALQRRDPAAWDALLQGVLPAYSTLALLAAAGGVTQALLGWLAGAGWWNPWVGLWVAALGALLLYPLLGLGLARAPARAYIAVALGPAFVAWRTWLAVSARWRRGGVTWVRTPRRGKA